jgi:hypothetical protein
MFGTGDFDLGGACPNDDEHARKASAKVSSGMSRWSERKLFYCL